MPSTPVTDARTAIRTLSLTRIPSGGTDANTVITDAEIDVHLDGEYRALHAEIAAEAPRYFMDVEDFTMDAADDGIHAVPFDFDRVWRLELYDETAREWRAIPAAEENDPNAGSAGATGTPSAYGLAWREEADSILFAPASLALGDFRLTYTTTVPVGAPGTGYTTLDLPAGFVLIVYHRVAAALVRTAKEEDPTFGVGYAAALWERLKKTIKRGRHGTHVPQGMRRVRGD